jgi:hypothetical protein
MLHFIQKFRTKLTILIVNVLMMALRIYKIFIGGFAKKKINC